MKIEIPKKSVLKLLGYAGGELRDSIKTAIDACILNAADLAEPKYAYWFDNITNIGAGVALAGAAFALPGADIRKHLAKSQRCCVLAVTIGEGIENESKRLMETDAMKGYILDACGSVAVENLADRVQEKIAKEAADEGLHLTSRYSPGYGDLTLDIQPKILELLDARSKLGLSITESYMLVPRKSITAFIGLQKEPFTPTIVKCTLCHAFEGCAFLKKGLFCGD
jgi:hypothetical protein